jgi:general secretion pathway protein M
MRAWWRQLAAHERRSVVMASAVLALILLYSLVWRPLVGYHARLQQRVAEQTEMLAWMQQAAQEVQQLRAVSGGVEPASAQSLLMQVDSSAKASGLGEALKRVEPEGNTLVRIWFEQTSFDATVLWLEQLKRAQGARIVSVVVEHATAAPAGVVNMRIALEGAAP